MPAKKIITKEIILQAALEMLETKGMDEINARSLAKKLHCSTQPIYLSFQSMEELKAALYVEGSNKYTMYIQESLSKHESLFFGYLLAYIFFARDYPNIFKLLFMSTGHTQTEEEKQFANQIVEGIMNRGNYTRETAYKFYLQSWIYAHGFAAQMATGYIEWKEKDIENFMQDEFEALKKVYGGK